MIVIVRQIRTKCRSRSAIYVEGDRLYIDDDRWKECKVPVRLRGRGRKNSRERAQYRFNDSGSFSIPSTIRTVDYRQESESPSTATPPLTPFFFPLVAIMLVLPRQLTVDRFYRFPSFATAWLVASFSTSRREISSSSYPDSKSLVPSSRPAVDIASIESDVESALSGSSGRPEYPPVSSTSSGNSPR